MQNVQLEKKRSIIKCFFGHKSISQIDKNFEKILKPNGIKGVVTLG